MIGDRLGSYQVTTKVGDGEAGEVFAAACGDTGRKASVRVLLPELSRDLDAVSLFFHDARVTAAQRDPALPMVYDYGLLGDGRAYMVSENVDGESLAARLRRRRVFPFRDALDVGRQLAAGLAAAHAAGVIHCELTLDNVLLAPADDTPSGLRVKILDFGISRLMNRCGDATGRATIMPGSPVCRAPEQCRGGGHIDGRADIYSFGCALFALLCGRPPFEHEGWGALIGAHVFEPPPAPRSLCPSLPHALEDAVLIALAKDPAHRQASMSELHAALSVLLARTPAGPSLVALPAPAPWQAGFEFENEEAGLPLEEAVLRLVETPDDDVANDGDAPAAEDSETTAPARAFDEALMSAVRGPAAARESFEGPTALSPAPLPQLDYNVTSQDLRAPDEDEFIETVFENGLGVDLGGAREDDEFVETVFDKLEGSAGCLPRRPFENQPISGHHVGRRPAAGQAS